MQAGQEKDTEPPYRGFDWVPGAFHSAKNILWPAVSALRGAGESGGMR